MNSPANYIYIDASGNGSFVGPLANALLFSALIPRKVQGRNRFFVFEGETLRAASPHRTAAMNYMESNRVLVEIAE